MDYKYKLVVAVRKDLKLSPGKMAVQVAHAAVTCSLKAKKTNPNWFDEWYREGQKKVVVKVQNEKELINLMNLAEDKRLPNALIADAGLTEIPPGTVTCLGIGPAPEKNIDEITGNLHLL